MKTYISQCKQSHTHTHKNKDITSMFKHHYTITVFGFTFFFWPSFSNFFISFILSSLQWKTLCPESSVKWKTECKVKVAWRHKQTTAKNERNNKKKKTNNYLRFCAETKRNKKWQYFSTLNTKNVNYEMILWLLPLCYFCCCCPCIAHTTHTIHTHTDTEFDDNKMYKWAPLGSKVTSRNQ